MKKALDDMVAELKAQQTDEVKKREFCKAEIDQNEDTIKEKDRMKEGLVTKIDDPITTIDTLPDGIDALKAHEELVQETNYNIAAKSQSCTQGRCRERPVALSGS